MKVAIFCTGGTNLGFGHFFRSKALASNAPEDLEVKLFPVVSVDDKHVFNEAKDLAILCDSEESAANSILNFGPDIIIFDTVYCSDDMFFRLKKHVKHTVSISPVFNQMKFIDILFTRNKNTESIGAVKIFKGFEYTVMSEHCNVISDEVYFDNLKKEFLTVGIAMGGGDAPNKTLQVLKNISKLEKACMFWVLLGEGYKHSYQELVNSIERDSKHEIVLAKTNRSAWNILSNCSVAILAGGLTTMEAVYAGLPTLNIFEKQEHVQATGTFIFEKGISENLGLFNDVSILTLKERLEYFNQNKSELLKMRERSKGVVDKLGPFRIFNELKKQFSKC